MSGAVPGSPRPRWRWPGAGWLSGGLALALVFSFRASREERAAEARMERPFVGSTRVLPGGARVRLSAVEIAAAGLETRTLEPAARTPEVPLLGVAMDPLDLSQVQAALREADAAVLTPPETPADAAPLPDEDAGNAPPPPGPPPPPDPAQRLARQTRRLRREVAERRFGGRITEWMQARAPELDDFLQSRATLLRLTPLPGWPAPRAPERARVEGLGGRWVEAGLVGTARVTDGRTAGPVFLFRVSREPGVPAAFLSGQSVYGWAPVGDPEAGVLVPGSAVVWSGEKPCVYVREDDSGDGARFARREIPGARPVAGGWFEQSAVLRPGEPVVTTGAGVLLSEEGRAELRTVD